MILMKQKPTSLLNLLTLAETEAILAQCPKRKENERILVGMSGGVDSSVSAALLKELGFNISGCWMRNWDLEEESNIPTCTQDKEWEDAQFVANSLDIEITRKDFSRDYWCSVWEPSLKRFSKGVTPNPDVMCNRQIKFGVFMNEFKDSTDRFATGHYARLDSNNRLMRGVDPKKDQSYFLSSVLPSSFAHACFPIGGLTKKRVKMLAMAAGFEQIATKPESQGVCFIGERKKKFARFLEDYLENPSGGRFIDVDTGRDLGQHEGLLGYTIGQRARVAGLTQRHFVASKDKYNVYVAAGAEHPSLLADKIVVKMEKRLFDENNIQQFITGHSSLYCQVRYHGEVINCHVTSFTESGSDILLNIQFSEKVFSVAEGQILALYQDSHCLGGGEILQVNRPFFNKSDS